METELDFSSRFIVERYRPYRQPARARSMATLLAELQGKQAVALDSYVVQLESSGGGLWGVWERESNLAIAVTAIDALPGLPDLYEMSGGVKEAWRRQGVGRTFAVALRHLLPPLGIQGLECLAANPGSERFLRAIGFHLGHQELMLSLPLSSGGSEIAPQPDLQLTTLPQDQVITTFRRLYEASFRNHRWHQPYEDDSAVLEWLEEARDLLFLIHAGRPIGFVWLQRGAEAGVVQLEPVGMVAEYQGRGWGRYMLQAALHEARLRSFARADIGVWQENKVALKLYLSLGFKQMSQRTFMQIELA